MSFFVSTRLVVFMLVGGNLCDIIAALGFCHNVAVCGKLKIGSFNSSAGKLQLLGTLAERRHFASGCHFPIQDQFPVVFVNFHIKMRSAVLIFFNV